MKKLFKKSLAKIILSITTLTFSFLFLFLSITCMIVGQNKAYIYTHSYNDAYNMYVYDIAFDIGENYARLITETSYPDALNYIKEDLQGSGFGISSKRYYKTDTTKHYWGSNDKYIAKFYYLTLKDQNIRYDLSLVSQEEYLEQPGQQAFEVWVHVSFLDNMVHKDVYTDTVQFFNFLYDFKYVFIFIAITSFIFIAATIFYMVKLNLHNSDVSNAFERFCNKPISTIIYAVTITATVLLTLLYLSQINNLLSFTYVRLYFQYYAVIMLTAMLASTIVSVFVYELIRRILDDSFVNRLLIVKIYNRVSIFGKGILIGSITLIWLIAAFVLSINVHLVFMPLAILCVVILWVIFAHRLNKLSTIVDNYATGNWDDCLTGNPLIIKDIYHNMNKISTSMQATVAKSVRDERTKTELITNVSHDIKTPLTSIINYTDLLKREDITDEERKQYLDTLSRNSARMKKLIEDLIEASKASTGNIELNMMNCNLSTLISQSVVEHSDNAVLHNLKIVCSDIKEDILIYVDGSKLYRVFDNIIGNACKYSLKGSRIYISAVVDEQVHIIFKNTSEQEITISPDELTERFVRGDISRHSEGSGLGLAISKSLTELMNGKLKLDIDGDQFKVTLSFPKITT